MDTLFRASLLGYLFVGMILVVLYSLSNRAPGAVEGLSAHDGRCGRNGPDCTEFSATVSYEADGRTRTTLAGAGSKYGHGHPTRYANRSVGDHVTVFWTDGSEDHGYVVPTSWPLMGLCLLLGPLIVLGGYVVIPRPDPNETYEELRPPTT